MTLSDAIDELDDAVSTARSAAVGSVESAASLLPHLRDELESVGEHVIEKIAAVGSDAVKAVSQAIDNWEEAIGQPIASLRDQVESALDGSPPTTQGGGTAAGGSGRGGSYVGSCIAPGGCTDPDDHRGEGDREDGEQSGTGRAASVTESPKSTRWRAAAELAEEFAPAVGGIESYIGQPEPPSYEPATVATPDVTASIAFLLAAGTVGVVEVGGRAWRTAMDRIRSRHHDEQPGIGEGDRGHD